MGRRDKLELGNRRPCAIGEA